MRDYYFIEENHHGQKIKTLIVSVSAILIIILFGLFFSAFWYDLITNIPHAEKITNTIKENIINTTPSGLFYAHFIGGIFFVPSPDEVIFYYGLTKGNIIFLALISALLGYMLAQFLNYAIGLKISPYILHIISKKKVYQSRRFIHKYGSYGIFIFNFLPFPAPLLTFALGIAKYNASRLFIITALGKTCKYFVVIGLYFIFSV